MKYVLDVSVAICWVIPRPLTPKADLLRDEYQRQIHELLAPAVFIDEVAGALIEAEDIMGCSGEGIAFHGTSILGDGFLVASHRDQKPPIPVAGRSAV